MQNKTILRDSDICHPPSVTKRGGESGQAIVLVALTMVGMLAMLGLVLDGGGLYFLNRDTQNAVDAALLAGAFALCGEAEDEEAAKLASIQSAVGFSVSENGFTDDDLAANTDDRQVDVIVTYPFNGDDTQVHIEIVAEKPSYFIQIVYGGPLRVSAEGVTSCDISSGGFYDGAAIVATGSTCSAQQSVAFSGSTFNIEGGIASNDSIAIGTSGMTITGNVSYVDELGSQQQGGCGGPNPCWNGVTINGETGSDATDEIQNLPVQDAPLKYHMDQFRPPWEQCYDQTTGGSQPCSGTYFTIYASAGLLYYYGPDGALASPTATLRSNPTTVTGQGYTQSSYIPSLSTSNVNSGFTFGSGGRPLMPTDGLVVFDSVSRGADGILGSADDTVYNFSASGTGGSVTLGHTHGITIVSSGDLKMSGPGFNLVKPLVNDELTLMSWDNAFANSSNSSARWYGYQPGANAGFSSTNSGECANGQSSIQTPSAGAFYRGLTYAPFSQVQFSASSAGSYGQVIAYSISTGVSSGTFIYESNVAPIEERKIRFDR